ncbi:SDR family oxidoreductase [soil metagenome]
MGKLDAKVALVTGAGQGVGQGIALALAAEGAAVALVGRTPETLDATASQIVARGGTALAIPGNVKDPDDVDASVVKTVTELGTVDILVNNAQQAPLGTLLEVSDRNFESGFRSGPLATLRYMRACHPHLCGGGAIVNLGSGSALRPDPVGLGAYAAVKDAIRVLTRAAAVEWGPDGIRANVVVPLALSAGLQWWSEHAPAEFEEMRAAVPLGRIGDCETDIGRAVAFLAGPDAGYITGSTLMVDGGQTYLR